MLRRDEVKGRKIFLYKDVKSLEDLVIIFLQDGEKFLFKENDILSKTIRNLDNIIIVGIEPIDRKDEYTPWKYKSFNGQGDEYLKFIINDLKPYIEKKCGVVVKKENSYLAGASLGGLISVYGLLEYPGEFQGGIIVSPSLWYKGFLEYINKKSIEKDLIIYMDIGAGEGKNKECIKKDILKNTKIFYGKLLESKLENKVYFNIIDDMKHNSNTFGYRIYRGIDHINNKIQILGLNKITS